MVLVYENRGNGWRVVLPNGDRRSYGHPIQRKLSIADLDVESPERGPVRNDTKKARNMLLVYYYFWTDLSFTGIRNIILSKHHIKISRAASYQAFRRMMSDGRIEAYKQEWIDKGQLPGKIVKRYCVVCRKALESFTTSGDCGSKKCKYIHKRLYNSKTDLGKGKS